ncbi:hypothetical protein GCM10010510_31590 [Streptomyces anandii JCM 4720]|nr:hypothetical protein GCM10010510_31590 [Streptomyces anandii JCM 4720]
MARLRANGAAPCRTGPAIRDHPFAATAYTAPYPLMYAADPETAGTERELTPPFPMPDFHRR